MKLEREIFALKPSPARSRALVMACRQRARGNVGGAPARAGRRARRATATGDPRRRLPRTSALATEIASTSARTRCRRFERCTPRGAPCPLHAMAPPTPAQPQASSARWTRFCMPREVDGPGESSLHGYFPHSSTWATPSASALPAASR